MGESDSFLCARYHPDRVGISHLRDGVHEYFYPEVERGGAASFPIGTFAFLWPMDIVHARAIPGYPSLHLRRERGIRRESPSRYLVERRPSLLRLGAILALLCVRIGKHLLRRGLFLSQTDRMERTSGLYFFHADHTGRGRLRYRHAHTPTRLKRYP